MEEFKIVEFDILKTGVDEGHTYIMTELIYKGVIRKLVILFSDKSDENKIKPNSTIYVCGKLVDQGIEQSLIQK